MRILAEGSALTYYGPGGFKLVLQTFKNSTLIKISILIRLNLQLAWYFNILVVPVHCGGCATEHSDCSVQQELRGGV